MAAFITQRAPCVARVHVEQTAVGARLSRYTWYPVDYARSTAHKLCLITPGGRRSVPRRDAQVVLGVPRRWATSASSDPMMALPGGSGMCPVTDDACVLR